MTLSASRTRTVFPETEGKGRFEETGAADARRAVDVPFQTDEPGVAPQNGRPGGGPQVGPASPAVVELQEPAAAGRPGESRPLPGLPLRDPAGQRGQCDRLVSFHSVPPTDRVDSLTFTGNLNRWCLQMGVVSVWNLTKTGFFQPMTEHSLKDIPTQLLCHGSVSPWYCYVACASGTIPFFLSLFLCPSDGSLTSSMVPSVGLHYR